MTQENRSSRQPDLEMIQVRRNPYLVDYRTGKNIVRHVGRRVGQPQDRQTGRYADQSRSNHTGGIPEDAQNGHNIAYRQCRRKAEGRNHIRSIRRQHSRKTRPGGRSRVIRAMHMSKMFTKTMLTAPASDNAGSEPRGSAAADRQESADILRFPCCVPAFLQESLC